MKELVFYEVCEECKGKGFRRFWFLLFTKTTCVCCGGEGKRRLPKLLADACFHPGVLAAKAGMRSHGFSAPTTFVRYE